MLKLPKSAKANEAGVTNYQYQVAVKLNNMAVNMLNLKASEGGVTTLKDSVRSMKGAVGPESSFVYGSIDRDPRIVSARQLLTDTLAGHSFSLSLRGFFHQPIGMRVPASLTQVTTGGKCEVEIAIILSNLALAYLAIGREQEITAPKHKAVALFQLVHTLLSRTERESYDDMESPMDGVLDYGNTRSILLIFVLGNLFQIRNELGRDEDTKE